MMGQSRQMEEVAFVGRVQLILQTGRQKHKLIPWDPAWKVSTAKIPSVAPGGVLLWDVRFKRPPLLLTSSKPFLIPAECILGLLLL